MKFKKGQRVRIIKDDKGFFKDEEGTIVEVEENTYGIIFDNFNNPLFKEKDIKNIVLYFKEDEIGE